MSQRDNDLIEHILDAAGKLAEIVAAGRENFDASWLVRSAAAVGSSARYPAPTAQVSTALMRWGTLRRVAAR